ncbi:MAG: ABC transporter substrate-binding protein [Christensenellaceae bacterium]|nr:ABC transporter substrate-binding protein [Christensenellaceae bacterium]
MKRKRILSILLAVVLIGVLFTGACAKDEGLKKITVSEVAHSVFYAPQYIAMELGYFEEEGLEIELINGGGADNVMTAILSGEAEIGLAGPEAAIYVLNEGKENHSVIFAQLTKRDGSFLVGREDKEFSWDMLRGSTIIGGRKGGVPEMTLEYVLKQNGLIPGKDVTIDTSIDFNLMAGAFTSGTGDYVTLFEPTAVSVEEEGQGYVLTSIGQESGEIPYTAYFASKEFIAENEDIIEKFTRAIAKGQLWVQEHTPLEIAELMLPYFADSELAVLEQVAASYKEIDAWNLDPIMKKEALEKLQDVMEEAGELEKRVDFDTLVDNSFAEKAIKELK